MSQNGINFGKRMIVFGPLPKVSLSKNGPLKSKAELLCVQCHKLFLPQFRNGNLIKIIIEKHVPNINFNSKIMVSANV